jgi:hypothetical protein
MMQLTSLINFSSVISFLGYRLHGIERLVATPARVPSTELSNGGWRAVRTAPAIAGLMTAGRRQTTQAGQSEQGFGAALAPVRLFPWWMRRSVRTEKVRSFICV